MLVERDDSKFREFDVQSLGGAEMPEVGAAERPGAR
jgi:hypothetical protein